MAPAGVDRFAARPVGILRPSPWIALIGANLFAIPLSCQPLDSIGMELRHWALARSALAIGLVWRYWRWTRLTVCVRGQSLAIASNSLSGTSDVVTFDLAANEAIMDPYRLEVVLRAGGESVQCLRVDLSRVTDPVILCAAILLAYPDQLVLASGDDAKGLGPPDAWK